MDGHVLVIMSPQPLPLPHDLAERAAAILEGASQPRWLAENETAEIPFTGDPQALTPPLAALFEGLTLDWAIVPQAARRKRLLVADMDSTMVTGETLDELAAVAGCGPQVAQITARSMNGLLDFATALRTRVALLAGLEAAPACARVQAAITPTKGAATLVRTMRANGAYTALVSGGFTLFTHHVKTQLGFDIDHANILEIAEGRLTGQVLEPILGREAKRQHLEALTVARGLSLQDTLAVGDGANDLAMIQAAGLGVAFHAKPIVAATAPVRVIHCDLTALLYLQGYCRSEFVL